MIVGPRYKICKRLGSSVFEKCQTQKFTLSEARAAQNKRGRGRRGTMSDYNKQLIEKQRMRYTYGLSEKQFRRYINETLESHGADPVATIVNKLETRLDNVIYRMGLVPSRRFARQLVSHGHITINGRRTTVPSHRVKEGDVIGIREGSREKTVFTKMKEDGIPGAPAAWLSFDIKKFEGKITGRPDNKNTELAFDPQQVLEFYSR